MCQRNEINTKNNNFCALTKEFNC